MAIQVKGLTEAIDALKGLDEKVQKKYLRDALKVGAGIVERAVVSESPVKSGRLKRAVKVTSRTKKGAVTATVAIGSKDKSDAWYAPFVELGHFMGRRLRWNRHFKGNAGQAEYHRLSVKAGRKWIPGQHYIKRAAQESWQKALDAITEKLVSLIESHKAK